MGPSGAGKSTLLDGLAGRIKSGSLKGRVSLDGATVSASLIKRISAYVMQEDSLFPITIFETLMFSADFHLGALLLADKRQKKHFAKMDKTDLSYYTRNGGVEGPLDDGFSWRKYGQKDILRAMYPGGYYSMYPQKWSRLHGHKASAKIR